MKKPGLPPNEEARLSQLRALEILDTDEEKVFDEITSLAAEVCGVKVSLITLLDETRQWFKSRYGISARETPREISFCGHTILGNEFFIVPDARKDERFCDNPIVTGPPHVVFYAAYPLSTPTGENLGTLCVIDSKPMSLTEIQKKTLHSLANHVMDLFKLRMNHLELMKLSGQYLDVQKMAKTGGWELSAETGEITWSAEVYSIYGLSLGAKPSLKDCVKFYAPYEQERISNLYWNSLQNGSSFDEVFEFRDNYLNEKWVRIIGEPVLAPDGKILKLKGTFQDITEHKETEIELRGLLESNRFILDSVGVGMWKSDLLTGEQIWDEKMYELHGVTRDTFVTTFDEWKKLLTSDSRKKIDEELEKIHAGSDRFLATVELVTPEGDRKFLGGSARVIRDDSGKPVSVYGINWDRTKEVELQKELDIERAKMLHHAKLVSIGQLAAGVGHEINNPLAVISSLVTILGRSPQEATKPEYIVKMEDSIDRIANIVKGLRTFARSDTGEISSFDPTLLIQETISFLEEIYDNEGVKIKFKTDAHSVSMTGNRGRIQQVLVNLLSNAKDATLGKQDRLIDVSVLSHENRMEIRIRDNGKGIPPEIQDRIFDPFYTTKDVNAGTGIGLSIVSTIVKEHQGKIDFTSRPGEGSEFRITFPVQELPQEVAVRSNSPREESQVVECNVLVVDDERELVEAMKMILELSFKNVYTATSAEEGLRITQEEKIDLVLSDVKMPVHDGFDFLRMLKATPKGKEVKFLFLTGGIDMTPEELNIVRTQSDGMIPKPIRFPDLIKKVRELFI